MSDKIPDIEIRQLEREMSDAMLKERKRRSRRKILRVLLAWLLAVIIIVAAVAVVLILVMAAGGRSLRSRVQEGRPNLGLEETVETTQAAGSETEGDSESAASITWQEGWVRHEGSIYAYNEDIMTFLVMGIDKMGTVQESESLTDGGQADALFLVVANPHEKEIDILAINRDTIVPVRMVGMGVDGTDKIAAAQIAVQHGYGDGLKQSCELTRDAVSALLYDLPIHGYVAVNMGAITTINDTVGGVELTVLEDLTKVSKNLKQGQEVTLLGMDAYYYVKYRDTTIFESARGRLARQKQYLGAFAEKFREATKKDLTLPVKLFGELTKYMVTDVTADEVTYLAGTLLDYQFTDDNIHTMSGETVTGEIYEEFYPDKDALKELMLELFYEEVEQ